MSGYAVAGQAGRVIAVSKMLDDRLSRFGFRTGRGGGHGARTMMLDEVRTLLTFVDDADASRETYVNAIEIDNCLGKRSGRSRKITARHLIELYALDPDIALFRSLLFFWKRDEEGRLLLALQCAFARDAILRMSLPFIFHAHEADRVLRESLEEFLDSQEPGRFSRATLRSIAQNINSTWTQSGHKESRVRGENNWKLYRAAKSLKTEINEGASFGHTERKNRSKYGTLRFGLNKKRSKVQTTDFASG